MQADLFEEPREAPVIEVHWHKSWEGRAILPIGECRHEGPDALTLNQCIENGKIALDGVVCMCCGQTAQGRLTLKEGLAACMKEHGWNRQVGLRLYDLAEAHQDELREGCCDMWMWYAFGFTGKEIVEMLNSGELEECGK